MSTGGAPFDISGDYCTKIMCKKRCRCDVDFKRTCSLLQANEVGKDKEKQNLIWHDDMTCVTFPQLVCSCDFLQPRAN